MSGFLLALQFLTIIPARAKLADEQNKLAQAALYFPLVGLLLGLILAATNKLFSFFQVNEFLTNVILLTLLIILTGALHLDGLADTADALFSRKSKREMLQIMRDPHLGTMGALSLIWIILLKLALLSSLAQAEKAVSLILMCLLSRYALVSAMFFFPYAREEGKAKIFMAAMNWRIFSLATGITLLCAGISAGLKGLIILVAAILFAFFIGKLVTKRIAGITGDALGAINELTEVFVLFSMLILKRCPR